MLINEVISNIKLDEGPNDPHIFKAIFLAGGPGSGKGFVVDNLMGDSRLAVSYTHLTLPTKRIV